MSEARKQVKKGGEEENTQENQLTHSLMLLWLRKTGVSPGGLFLNYWTPSMYEPCLLSTARICLGALYEAPLVSICPLY